MNMVQVKRPSKNCSPWSPGFRPKILHASVAPPPALLSGFLACDHLSRASRQSYLSANDKGDNEMKENFN